MKKSSDKNKMRYSNETRVGGQNKVAHRLIPVANKSTKIQIT